jgi:hypothetical protein
MERKVQKGVRVHGFTALREVRELVRDGGRRQRGQCGYVAAV